MTPELSDQELIEAVATRVMGWGVVGNKAFKPGCGWILTLGDGKTGELDWNPLTSWQCTMEVVTHCIERGCSVKIGMGGRKRPITGERLSSVSMHNGTVTQEVRDWNPQRAICLAALQAVTPPDSLPKP
jgi:hypothetical protein